MNKFALRATVIAIGLAASMPLLASFEQNGSPKYVFQVQYAAFAKPTKQALRELIPNVFEVYIHKDSKLPETMSWHAGQDWVSIAKQLTWSGDLQLRIDWQELAVYIRPANLTFAQSLQPTEPQTTQTQGQLTVEAKVSVSGQEEITEIASSTFEIAEEPSTSLPSTELTLENAPIVLNDTIEPVTNQIDAAASEITSPQTLEQAPVEVVMSPQVEEVDDLPVGTELTEVEKQAIASYEALQFQKQQELEAQQAYELAQQLADELAAEEAAKLAAESAALELRTVDTSSTIVIETSGDDPAVATNSTTIESELGQALETAQVATIESAPAINESVQTVEPSVAVDSQPEPEKAVQYPVANFFSKLFAPKKNATAEESVEQVSNELAKTTTEESNEVLVIDEPKASEPYVTQDTSMIKAPEVETTPQIEEEVSKVVFVFDEGTNLRAALTELIKDEGWNLVWKAPESKNVISNYFASYEAADLKSLLKLVLPNFGLKAERYVTNKVIVIK